MPKLPVTLPTSTGPALTLVPFATATVTMGPNGTPKSVESSTVPTTINIQPMISKPTSVSPVSNLLNNNTTTVPTSVASGNTPSGGGGSGGSYNGPSSGAVTLITNNNQTDYFRNCNVPNLINKWRRRHTWLFLKEGKMFCQVWRLFLFYLFLFALRGNIVIEIFEKIFF